MQWNEGTHQERQHGDLGKGDCRRKDESVERGIAGLNLRWTYCRIEKGVGEVLMWVGAQHERHTYNNGVQLRSRNDNLGIRGTLHPTYGMVQSRETEERKGKGEEQSYTVTRDV